jgi:hypothetical protein
MQPCLNQWLPLWASILISGFIFGLCHMITPTYFIIAWLISIYLALLLVFTDNLLVPMITHGVYDLIALFAVLWLPPTPVAEPNQPETTTLTPPPEPIGFLPSEPLPSSTDRAPDSGE